MPADRSRATAPTDDTTADTTADAGVGADPAAGGQSYEEARAELAEVVRRLEAGGTGLEESLALWERGEALADTCQQWLDGARRRLDDARATRPGQD